MLTDLSWKPRPNASVRRLALFLLFAACGGTPAPPAPPMPVGVVATVEGRTLTSAELRERVIEAATRQQTSPEPCAGAPTCPETPEHLVDRVIEERTGLLVAEVHGGKTGIRVTDAEVDAELDRMVRVSFQARDVVLQAAKDQGYSDIRRYLGESLLVAKLWAAGPGKTPLPELDTEAKQKAVLARAYDQWKVLPEHQFVELRILAFHAPTPELVAYTTGTLTRLRERVEAGEDFCAVIEAHAMNDTDRSNCGTAGPLPVTMFAPDVQKRIAGMKPMVVAGPFPFQSAMALFQITDVPKPRPLEHVSRELWEEAATEIQDRAIGGWLRALGVTYGLRLGSPDRQYLRNTVNEVRRTVPAPDPQRLRERVWIREVVRNVVVQP